jgi:hypothetical protein
MKTALLLFLSVAFAVGSSQLIAKEPPRNTPAFELDAAARRALVEKTLALKIGDTYDTAIEKLGKPSNDDEQWFSQPREYVGRAVEYWVVRESKVGSIEINRDQYVFLTFDKDNRLAAIYIRITLTK